MRRKDREVSDSGALNEMLYRCDTLRIGITGDPYPYIVPVSFGMETGRDGKPILYIHSAKEGEKIRRLRAHPEVCIEADRCLGIEKTAGGITSRYESIIGYGKCAFVEDPEEIKKGLQLILAHYGHPNYPLDRCRALNQVQILRVKLDSLSGKRNVPPEGKEKTL